jgi:hypothetical protein
VPSLATPATRERTVSRINARYLAHLAVGYPVTLEGNAETLQVAREVDGINWLIVARRAEKAILAGLGDVPGLAFLQTTSNARYEMTCNEAVVLLDALEQWGIDAWDNWNRLKNLARAARFSADLEAIDLEEGWP